MEVTLTGEEREMLRTACLTWPHPLRAIEAAVEGIVAARLAAVEIPA